MNEKEKKGKESWFNLENKGIMNEFPWKHKNDVVSWFFLIFQYIFEDNQEWILFHFLILVFFTNLRFSIEISFFIGLSSIGELF